jgi:DNA-directed RNA polymerase
MATKETAGGYAQVIQHSPSQRDTTIEPSNKTRIEAFLQSSVPYTFLPNPLPEDVNQSLVSMYFPDSNTQDSFAVIDACLHNCYDVDRAQYVFDQLRRKPDEVPLHVHLYNAFLNSYFAMATEREVEKDAHWLEETWSLYEVMESGKETIEPNANTYAIMMRFWRRYVKNFLSVLQLS